MKNVDKYFSLKSINKREVTLKKQKSVVSNHHPSDRRTSNSRSNEELIDEDTDEVLNREAKMAEEAYAANLKLLKKQKAKFIRLQKILSRNVILIPLCAIFSVLSAFSIITSTLTDHFELISYDIDNLRNEADSHNNKTLLELNAKTGLNLSVHEFLNSQQRKLEFATDETSPSSLSLHAATNAKLESVDSSMLENSASQYVNDLSAKKLENIIREYQLYEVSNIIDDYYVVKKRGYYSNDNNTLKTNILYDTYTGIWKFCNYLSSNYSHEISVFFEI